MDDPAPVANDLRTAWQDATRAAVLAERLVEIARDVTDRADRTSIGSDEIARLAGAAADAAGRAAGTARTAASEATDDLRAGQLERMDAPGRDMARGGATEAAAG